MMNHYWGYHLMLDCSNCSPAISDRNAIYQFVKQLVKDIDMIAHGEPIIEHLLPGEDNAGYSLMQLITTSNITAHFVDSNHSAYIDVFSCKEFDIETVKSVVKQYFDPKQIKLSYLTRHAD